MRKTTTQLALFTFAAALAGGPAAAASDDAQFVKEAASGGMMEVELGRYASQHAESAKVREFGQRMVTDHSKANEALKAAAKRAGQTVPTQMTDEHRQSLDRLTKLKGREFDEAYMKAMVEDHEKDVSAFRDQAKQPQSEVDRWAAETLPTLEAHLTQAKSVEQSVSGEQTGKLGVDGGRLRTGQGVRE